MRSRPARLTLSALAWIALGAAALFTVHQQQQIDSRRAALRAFESTARDAVDALDDLQVSQQAYVATGQDAAEWIPKVTTFLQTATTSIDALRSAATSSVAGPSLLDASTTMTQVGNIDRTVRQHLAADETDTAAQSVFGEAADAISSTVSNVDAAVTAEQQAAGILETERRRAQVYALGGAAGLTAIVIAMLGLASPAGAREHEFMAEPSAPVAADSTGDPGMTPTAPAPVSIPATNRPVAAADASTALSTLAGMCTEFGRVRDAEQLNQLLAQAATLLNARGLIVWLGNASGADLRPVLAYGYRESTLSHLSSMPKSADNAAAAAYRSGEVQIIKARPGGAEGTVIAPLLSTDGCIGALTAEIHDGGEQIDTTRALAQILAAQLAGVLASAAEATASATPETRTAAG